MDLLNFKWKMAGLGYHLMHMAVMKALGSVNGLTQFESFWEFNWGQNNLDYLFFLGRRIAASVLFTCQVLAC